jgi:trigger factor
MKVRRMKVAVEDITAVKKSLRIEVPQEVVNKEFENIYSDLKKRIKVPGFRQGKVPLTLLERRFAQEVESDVVKRLIPDYYQRALKEKGITPVISPTIEKVEIKRNAPLSFTATVETKPDFTLTTYEGLSLNRKKINVTEAAVDEALKALQETHGQLSACEPSHEICQSDFVLIDFEGRIDGKSFEGDQATGLLVQIGSNKLPPGFEEQLLGKRKGEEALIKIHFPSDLQRKELAGKEAEFLVKIREVKIKSLPDLDDEFAKDLGDYPTLSDFKQALRQGLDKQARRETENDIRNQAIQKLTEKHPMEIPPSLIERELSSMLLQLQQQLQHQGQSFDPSDPQWSPIRKKYEAIARERIHGRLILQEIARKEKITLDNRDVESELTQMAQQTKHNIAEIHRHIRSNEEAMEELRTRLLEDKALSLVLSRATYTENE